MTGLASSNIKWAVFVMLLPSLCYCQEKRSSSQVAEIFTIVESPPEYTGGDKKFMKFMKKNSKFKITSKEGIGLTVFYQFVITDKGDVDNIRIIENPPSYAQDYPPNNVQKELIRLLEMMPKWIPGYQNGKPVNVRQIKKIAFVFD